MSLSRTYAGLPEIGDRIEILYVRPPIMPLWDEAPVETPDIWHKATVIGAYRSGTIAAKLDTGGYLAIEPKNWRPLR